MVNAGLMLLNLLWFLWVVRSFEYKAVEHPSMRPAPAQKPQGTLPPWVQPQVVSGVQQANVSVGLQASLHDIALSWQMRVPAGCDTVLYIHICSYMYVTLCCMCTAALCASALMFPDAAACGAAVQCCSVHHCACEESVSCVVCSLPVLMHFSHYRMIISSMPASDCEFKLLS